MDEVNIRITALSLVPGDCLTTEDRISEAEKILAFIWGKTPGSHLGQPVFTNGHEFRCFPPGTQIPHGWWCP